MKEKKLYIVSREVMAVDIKKAMSEKGVIYSIYLAEKQPTKENKKSIGFSKKIV